MNAATKSQADTDGDVQATGGRARPGHIRRAGCGVLVAACLLVLFAGDTSYEQHHNSARGAVRIAVLRSASRRKPSGPPATNSRELLLQHAEALSTATNQFNDTIYERVFSRSAAPPRCLEQCDIVPEPESRPTKSYNRVAIACPTALFVGPQWMYYPKQLSDFGAAAFGKPEYAVSRFSQATGLDSAALRLLPLQRGGLKELAIFDNAPAQRTSVVLTGYDNNIGVQPFAKHLEEQLPAVRRLFAANVGTGNQEVIEYEAEGHTGAYKSIKTKHLEVVPIPMQIHACGEGGQPARVEHTQNFWRDFRGNSDHMHSQSKLMLLNFNVKNSPERGYLMRLSEGWDFADAPHGDTHSKQPDRDVYARFNSYKFIASPRGRGTDCYRHWEAMLMGSIPVLKIPAGAKFRELFDDLPVLIVDRWTDVTAKLLTDYYAEVFLPKVAAGSYRLAKLTITYWASLFGETGGSGHADSKHRGGVAPLPHTRAAGVARTVTRIAMNTRCGTEAWLGQVDHPALCMRKVLARPATECSHRYFVLADLGDNNCACAPPSSGCVADNEVQHAVVSSVYRVDDPVL